MANSPSVIEVTGVGKAFRVPLERSASLRDAVSHPLRHRRSRELVALRDVSFEVRRGEFFGIAGRNGSGKSTLLKLLASIYRADRGRIRLAGRLAPFIELGVGFNPELLPRDNVVLNGVMMGLSRREAERRFDRIMDFAELREFHDLKLKNYSAGMQVRLAFAVMLEVDADILLFDEVLAVGDAGFQEKCATALQGLRSGPQTIVLVTHAMPQLQLYCDRALLLEDSVVQTIGDPDRVVGDYMKVTLDLVQEGGLAPGMEVVEVVEVRGLEVAGKPGDGGVVEVAPGDEIAVRGELVASEPVGEPRIGFELLTITGVRLFVSELVPLPGRTAIAPGERARFSIQIENRLAPGAYVIRCGAMRARDGQLVSLGPPAQVEVRLPDAGEVPRAPALVRLDYEIGDGSGDAGGRS